MSHQCNEDSAYWESALELYHHDKLEESYSLVRTHGIGEAGAYIRWYRLIEAEYVSRARSTRRELTPWLTFEFVEDDVSDLESLLVEHILEACEGVANRLGWDHSAPTLLAILAKEVDAPWATNPHGYCVDKYPYEKICLPDHLIDDPEEFRQAVAHEYAHVVSLNLADGYAPRWLEEAVSVLSEHRFDPDSLKTLRDEPGAWLSPDDLEVAFNLQENEDPGGNRVWLAYQQAGLIGRYLTSLGDERRLGDLLREHAHEGLWRNFLLQLAGKDRVDGALKATYKMSVGALFRSAREYLSKM